MSLPRALYIASIVSLIAGAIGCVLALRHTVVFDLPFGWSGEAKHIHRDMWLLGTGLSTPVLMQVVQAIATALLETGSGFMQPYARLVLTGLGYFMVLAYLLEHAFRESFMLLDLPRIVVCLVNVGAAAVMAWAGTKLLRADGIQRPSRHGARAEDQPDENEVFDTDDGGFEPPEVPVNGR